MIIIIKYRNNLHTLNIAILFRLAPIYYMQIILIIFAIKAKRIIAIYRFAKLTCINHI